MPQWLVTSLSHPSTLSLSHSLYRFRSCNENGVVKMLWMSSYLRELCSLICLLRGHIPSLDTRFLRFSVVDAFARVSASLSLGTSPSLSPPRAAPSPSVRNDDSCFLPTAALNNGFLNNLFSSTLPHGS